MGNSKSKKQKYDEIESMLLDAYKNTDIDFSFKEVTTFKLRLHDAENYFQTKFDFMLYFNNYLFKDKLSTLYDNFNSKIEAYSTSGSKPTFTLLVDFDDESENIALGARMDFESLFTIIFEKLEISIVIFFDMTNADISYLSDFFLQLYESVDLYKYNRKFDCLYFLLPNTDYFVKNDCSLLYISDKIIHNKKLFVNDEVNEIRNEFIKAIFLNNNLDKFLNAKYQKTTANDYLEFFIEKIKPTFVKTFSKVNFTSEIESFILFNEDFFKLLELQVEYSTINSISLELPITMVFKGNRNIEILVKKVVNLMEKSKIEENVFIVKFILKYKKNQFINEAVNPNQINTGKNFDDIERMITVLIQDFSTYTKVFSKRKLILEFYEFTQIFAINQSTPAITSTLPSLNESEEMTTRPNQIIEYSMSRERMFFYWFIHRRDINEIKLYICLLVSREKYKKLYHKKIILTINSMLSGVSRNKSNGNNYIMKHSIQQGQVNDEQLKEIMYC